MKAVTNTGSSETLVVAAVILVLATAFGVRLWQARRHRFEEAVSEDDTRHYASRDRRRAGVATVLALIGLGMIATTGIDARRSPADARLWGWSWLGILALTIVLLVLALLDWLATVSYARRQVRALAEEHRSLLTEAIRHHASRHDGQGPPDDSR